MCWLAQLLHQLLIVPLLIVRPPLPIFKTLAKLLWIITSSIIVVDSEWILMPYRLLPSLPIWWLEWKTQLLDACRLVPVTSPQQVVLLLKKTSVLVLRGMDSASHLSNALILKKTLWQTIQSALPCLVFYWTTSSHRTIVRLFRISRRMAVKSDRSPTQQTHPS